MYGRDEEDDHHMKEDSLKRKSSSAMRENVLIGIIFRGAFSQSHVFKFSM